jgi:hypothetical protein
LDVKVDMTVTDSEDPTREETEVRLEAITVVGKKE